MQVIQEKMTNPDSFVFLRPRGFKKNPSYQNQIQFCKTLPP